MKLYLLRHAIAQDRDQWRGKDADRPLTQEGIEKMKEISDALGAMSLHVDEIWTSPYARAHETARIVARALGASKKLRVEPALAASNQPSRLIDLLAQPKKPMEALLIVGHEPYLSRLVSRLIGAEQPLALELKKGGLAMLKAAKIHHGPCAELKWWVPPKLLRKLKTT